MIPSWVPRWHPFVWLAVIIAVYLVWTEPALWGSRAGGVLHMIPELAHKVGILIQNI